MSGVIFIHLRSAWPSFPSHWQDGEGERQGKNNKTNKERTLPWLMDLLPVWTSVFPFHNPGRKRSGYSVTGFHESVYLHRLETSLRPEPLRFVISRLSIRGALTVFWAGRGWDSAGRFQRGGRYEIIMGLDKFSHPLGHRVVCCCCWMWRNYYWPCVDNGVQCANERVFLPDSCPRQPQSFQHALNIEKWQNF